MAEVRIKVFENGPLVVKGPIHLVDADGTDYDVSEQRIVKLCRCGASTDKPFCDGAHSRLGFEAAERAVRDRDGVKPVDPEPDRG